MTPIVSEGEDFGGFGELKIYDVIGEKTHGHLANPRVTFQSLYRFSRGWKILNHLQRFSRCG
ncbi:MAG: hypothetical protein WAM82_00345 [Thermoanaerobaculia bacterium]